MNDRLLILAMLCVLTACGAGPASEDGTVLRTLSDRWEQALNDGDIDALVGLYTEDARIMPPNLELAEGSAAVRAAFGAMIDAGFTGTLTSVEARIAGDLGYNAGTYELRAADGPVDRGKFVEIWRRQGDGSWRISNDIWNSDAPPPAPPEDSVEARLVFIHEVGDPDAWLAAWAGEDRRQQFANNGVNHVHVFQNDTNPKLTGLVISVYDLEAFEAFLGSEEGAQAAADDTVDLENMQRFLEK